MMRASLRPPSARHDECLSVRRWCQIWPRRKSADLGRGSKLGGLVPVGGILGGDLLQLFASPAASFVSTAWPRVVVLLRGELLQPG